jgi:predicted methyltransferase
VPRDRYRHPAQTLDFFGVKPDQTVLEIWPSAGWYTELLAPYLRASGHYVAIVNDPAKATSDKTRDSWTATNDTLRAKLAARPDVYGTPELRLIDPAAPDLGPPGSADVVLTFRNVHNWVMAGTEADMFEAFFEVLKPGGVLGVVDHRARADAPAAEMKTSGYLPEQAVIAMALRAGFRLDARSEVNANPKDTADYPDGVWTLPPRLVLGDKDRDKYLAIGESDRMTLRFVKPAD